MNDHIAGEEMAAYVDGKLEGAKKLKLESHLSHCADCLDELADIVDIQGRRAKIPNGFLRQVLGEKRVAPKPLVSMRLVFGIAAVFLVVVVIGYFFLSNNRLWRNTAAQKERSDRVAAKTVFRKSAEAGRSSPAPAAQLEPAGDVKAEKRPVAKGMAAKPPPGAPLEKKQEPDAVAILTAPVSAAEEWMLEQRQELEPPPPQRAALEKDKSNEMKMTGSGSAARPALAAQNKMADEGSFRSRSAATAAAGAVQLFLAVSGRAAAPSGMNIAALSARPPICIEGDATWVDLQNFVILDGWTWLKKGMALELAIDPAGVVTNVFPVGKWDAQTAAQADQEAKKLIFSVSEKKSRQVTLTACEVSSN
jgi:hypothetical protein